MAQDQTYFVNQELLKALPKNAKHLLIFDSATDSLAHAYKQENPFCILYGVVTPDNDIDIPGYDHVLVGHINDLSLTTIKKHFSLTDKIVDCIVYHDTVLYCTSPEETINEHTTLLHDEGSIICTFPNVSHWHIISQQLHGKWNYVKGSAIDPHYVRFYSDGNIRQFFDSLSMHITKHSFNLLDDENNHKAFFQLILPLLKAQQPTINEQYAFNLTRIYKYLATAQRHKQDFTLRIQSMMLKPVGAVNDVRIIEPNNFLGSIPHVITNHEVKTFNILPEECPEDEIRIFIWHRPIMDYQNCIPTLKKLIQHNYLIVVEFDDDLDHWPKAKAEKYLTLTGCHAVQTTNETIAKSFRKHNPEVGIFPNQIAKLPEKKPFNDGKKLHVFFGAIGRDEDWKPIFPSIKKFIKKYNNTLHFHVIHDQEFFDLLPTKHKSFTPLCEYSKYQEILSSCDIALLPLEDTRFNNMKSDLKFIECAAYGTAALAPPVVYGNSIKHKETGLLYHSIEEFESLFDMLVEDASLRQSLVDNAYDYVKNERLLCLHYMDRYDWYLSLYKRKDELHKALLERVPELLQ